MSFLGAIPSTLADGYIATGGWARGVNFATCSLGLDVTAKVVRFVKKPGYEEKPATIYDRSQSWTLHVAKIAAKGAVLATLGHYLYTRFISPSFMGCVHGVVHLVGAHYLFKAEWKEDLLLIDELFFECVVEFLATLPRMALTFATGSPILSVVITQVAVKILHSYRTEDYRQVSPPPQPDPGEEGAP